MLFNSDIFMFAFLPVTLLGYYLLGTTGRRAAATWLIAASFFFYGWWNPAYVWLLALSVTLNYLCALAIANTHAAPRRQTVVLTVGIVLNVLVLFYYKYLGWILPGIWGGEWVLPLGISFFTFTQIGYLIDCRQGVAKERGATDYALFVTFFPHLIAGPILHHSEIMPQFAQRQTYRLQLDNLSVGLTIFVLGLAKKVLFADPLAIAADAGFEHPDSLRLLGAWSTVLSYSLQLYFDFSGYSDMALGLARLFGVKFPLNFNSPYKSRCIIDFWQRWHMTLTRYITLYLYNPILLWVTRRRVARGYGISRRATATPGGFASTIVLPTTITMALAGIWHGAGLQFLCYGLLHGCYLSINHAWRLFGPPAPKTARPSWVNAVIVVGQVLLTYLAVLVGQIFFRATTTQAALSLLATMVGLHGIDLHGGDLPPIGLHTLRWQYLHAARIAGLFAIAWFLPNTQQIMGRFAPTLSKFDPGREGPWRWQPTFAWALAIAAVFLAVFEARLGDPSRFLYFQF